MTSTDHASTVAGAAKAVAIAAAAAVLATACRAPAASQAPASSGSGATGTTGTAATALADLAALRIAPEDTGVHYRREDWTHWIDQPGFGKGCDTREMVLVLQGHHAGGGPVVRNPTTCRPDKGHGNSWTSLYDGVTVTDPGELDIDHLVPLKEAARSGARSWSAEHRQAYANDPDVLIAVTAHSNRAKGDDDPAKWTPDQGRCLYVERWTAIKRRYGLTIDQAEHDAIASILHRCS